MLDISPWLLFLLIGSFAWASSAPRPWSHDETARYWERRARRRAARAACKAQRQADRRRLFGSHPHLYWGLAWLSPILLLALLTLGR